MGAGGVVERSAAARRRVAVAPRAVGGRFTPATSRAPAHLFRITTSAPITVTVRCHFDPPHSPSWAILRRSAIPCQVLDAPQSPENTAWISYPTPGYDCDAHELFGFVAARTGDMRAAHKKCAARMSRHFSIFPFFRERPWGSRRSEPSERPLRPRHSRRRHRHRHRHRAAI